MKNEKFFTKNAIKISWQAPEIASTALNSMYNTLINLDSQEEKFHKTLNKMELDVRYLKIALKSYQ
ncbi:hypothetical protein KDE12_00335 [Campylobacter sp. faydin G-105]|uniref:hypothetical protein n=1 Tax=Campylobacter anatolicus TaxID=2829105 RepID=UPI001BA1E8D8|nr:hypothetical protein [Campylobacter anatolicus]MBR8461302.1 hypothetical protein [Campylobacter anatolicus]